MAKRPIFSLCPRTLERERLLLVLNWVQKGDQFGVSGRAYSQSLIGREVGNPGIELVRLVHPVNPLFIQLNELLEASN